MQGSDEALTISTWNRGTGLLQVSFVSDKNQYDQVGYTSFILVFNLTNPSKSQSPPGILPNCKIGSSKEHRSRSP